MAHEETCTKNDLPTPEFIPWSQLQEEGTGVLPFLLDVIGIVVFVVSAVCIMFTFLAPLVGAALWLSLHTAATVIRTLRATQAHTAYAEALLVHIAEKK